MQKWLNGQLQYDIMGYSFVVIIIVGLINMKFFDNSELGIFIVFLFAGAVFLFGVLNLIVMLSFALYEGIKYLISKYK